MKHPTQILLILAALLLAPLTASPVRAASLLPTDLRVEYLAEPLGVDVTKPRFFWQDIGSERGAHQAAYQIQVRQGRKGIWDSGKVESAETIQVEYAGAALASDTSYDWRVRVWDQRDRASDWSREAKFATSFFKPEDWKAKWIGRRPEEEWRKAWDARRAKEAAAGWKHENASNDPVIWHRFHDPPYDAAPLLRKRFALEKPVKEARLYVTGLGQYEVFLNGRRLDGGAIAPGVTDYNKRVLYNCYDVTRELRRGGNALSVMLGRGWYDLICYEVWDFAHASWLAQPKALVQLSVVFSDGSRALITSDETWKVADGPLVFDDMRRGEIYDARREVAGWSEAAFEDAAWVPASLVPPPKGKLCAELMEPIRPTAEFKPAKLIAPPPSSTNVTAKVQAAVKGSQLAIRASNSLFGEPAPGQVKTLRVEYLLGGKKQTREAVENTLLEINGGGQPLTILKAEYGADAAGSSWLFESPQNLAGRARLHLDGRGRRGETVRLTYYPYRDRNGHLGMNVHGQEQYYIVKGESDEVAELHFAYFGARYVLVRGLSKPPRAEDMTLFEVRSAVESAGEFECSDPLLNRLHSNIRWTQSGALHSFPQDCWTREKLGWTGDAHLTAEEAIFNFGMAAHYTKYAGDHRDNQRADGGIAALVPSNRDGNESVTWSGSCVLIPWQLYTYYGDKRILAENFDTGARFLAAAHQEGKRPLIYFGGPGDWCPSWAKTREQIPDHPDFGVTNGTFPGAPEGHLFYGTAYHVRLARTLAQMAEVLGRADDAARYRKLATDVTAALSAEFFDEEKHVYHGNKPSDYRQSANALALWLDLVPREQRQAVLDSLLADIAARHGHLNAGVLGTQALFEALSLAGHADTAFEIATQKTYPGYLWPMLEYDLTTLPEHWEGFGTHEHPMFGSVGAFFYKWLAGIQPDPAAPRFKQFSIRQSVDNPLQFVKASYRSIRGPIRSEWRKEGRALTLRVEIPANTEADVFVPKFGHPKPRITEDSQVLPGGEDVGDAVKFRLGSGKYAFRVL